MDTVIIDSGGANLASLQFALERLDVRAVVSNDPQDVTRAPRVILPGVGSAQDAMTKLRATGLHTVLPTLKQPVLGICLGMQLLFARSEEGPTECLGIIPDTVRRLRAEPGRPVPHMGWNQLTALRPDPLLANVEANEYVYFVHSYAAPVSDVTLAATDYGSQVSAVVRRGNFWGTQFHPERSGATGAKFLANFLRLS
ncbi:MAG TPA: imidazole glycerol phosphate synthase subunit HisH [Steroidobacteraceae bacterium]|jgi:glutamine amidotransferase|nr:imidazole glycerol phosphate synthase subunit HisH [Steroidobacteraceae bacterium]